MKGNLITDVSKTTWEELFKKRYKKYTYLVIFLSIVVLFLNPIFSIAIFFCYYFTIRAKVHRQFIQEFAKINGFEFMEKMEAGMFSGKLFSIGHSRKVYFVVSGKYADYPIKIFNYEYITGSGKNSHTYAFTVCEIEIKDTQFPHIFLKSDSMWHIIPDNPFDKDKIVRINLEGEFEKKFNLYCTEDYEIEVLQIFDENLLRYLSDHGNNFSIEFSGNKIYFYDDVIISNKNDLDNLYNVVRKVLDNSGNLMKRLHDDFESLHEVYRKQ